MNSIRHHLLIDGQRKGPFTLGQLQGMWRSGAVTSETLHHMDGYADWMPLEIIVEDLDPAPPPRHYQAMPSRAVVVAKSRGIYIILGLFLGGLVGIHNFYAGRFWPAVAQLLITVFTFWLVLPLFAVALWVIIECLCVTKDGKGVPMS